MAQTQKQEVGQIGENCAATYLERHGFKIIERNYRKKYGEIDIIATKEGILHFVEVKSVTTQGSFLGPGRRLPCVERGESLGRSRSPVGRQAKGLTSDGDDDDDDYEAEENVHPWKLKRLRRTIEAYLLSKYPDDDDPASAQGSGEASEEPDWQLDVATVEVDREARVGRVRILSDIDIC